MTAFDLVYMMRDFMKRMSKFDIKMNDYKHIDMFQEYKRLEGQGAKKEYIKAELHASDYKAIKHSEGLISDEDYQPIKEERQSIREEINKVEAMTEEEYRFEYPQEETETIEEWENYPEEEEII